MTDEWRPSKRQHYWERPEYWEESWRLEETCCHSNSREKPPVNADVKNSKGVNNKNDDNDNNINNYYYYYFSWDFQCSLNDNNSSRVSRTLLTILANLTHAMVSIGFNTSPDSSSSGYFFPSFWRPFQGQQPQLVSTSPSSFTFFFSVLFQGSCIFLYFCFLLFSFCDWLVLWNLQDDEFLFLLNQR